MSITFNSDDLAYLAANYARKDSTPSLAETFIGSEVGTVNTAFSSGFAYYVFTAPFPLKIVTGYFFTKGPTTTASNTNYFYVSLAKRKNTDASYNYIVKGYSCLSGGPQANNWAGDLVANKSYSWNAFTFDTTNATFAAGDTLSFEVTTQAGSPTLPQGGGCVTVGYQIL